MFGKCLGNNLVQVLENLQESQCSMKKKPAIVQARIIPEEPLSGGTGMKSEEGQKPSDLSTCLLCGLTL